MVRDLTLLLVVAATALGQATDPAYAPLAKAYEAVRARDYDVAIASFQLAIVAAPDRASIRKDLGYALLKTGQNEAARDQFAEAMRLDPADQQVALEYAFLCYETKQQAVARRVFDRLRKTGNATAEQAFQNIDRPLADGMARWSKAIELSPDNFSAHQELARLAEQRDDLAYAAEHYEKAWRLRPTERELLVDLGRVWKALGCDEDAMSALLAASRGPQARAAERAREFLPPRYPYVYEFQKATAFDPPNTSLRRELAYLLLEMNRKKEAEDQFRKIHELAPGDLMSAAQLGFLMLKRGDEAGAKPLFDEVLQGNDEELANRVRLALKMPPALRQQRPDNSPPQAIDVRVMAEKSLRAGYLKDAIKYLTLAQEADPLDYDLMLKLAITYNNLHEDREAVRWFQRASKSPDPEIADRAKKGYTSLEPQFQRVRFSSWLFPFYSTRWHDAFGYAQMKQELKLGPLPLRIYLSARFVGDLRGRIGPTTADPYPAYLSESSVILGLGLATSPWQGLTAWFEAGESFKYLDRSDVGAAIPDYRGGLAFARGVGHLMGSRRGLFAETNDDGVYVSRFQNDMLLYSQNRTGYTFAASENSLGGFQPQVFWNYNVTADRLTQYWANFVETGPGVRFRLGALSKSLLFSVNFLRGVYLVNAGNPRRPNFYDLRVGFWYAFSH